MKNLLILGHSGLVGSALDKIYRLKSNGSYNIIKVAHSDCDLTNPIQVASLFKSYDNDLDLVIVAAGTVGGIITNSKHKVQFMIDNISIATNVIQAAAKTNVKKLIYLSSSCVYPRMYSEFSKISENKLLSTPLEKSNEGYALAKIVGMKLCQYYHIEQGKNFYSLMPCNVYGANDNYNLETSHVLPAMIRRIHEAKVNKLETLEVLGDERVKREFIHSDDLAYWIWLFGKYIDADMLDEYDVNWCNVGSGQNVTLGEMADVIKDIVGWNGKIKWNGKMVGVRSKLMADEMRKQLFFKHVPAAMCKQDPYSLSVGISKTYTDFITNNNLRK